MINNFKKIARAFHLRNVESKRERRNFEVRQASLYQEKLIQTKLEEQILSAVAIMQSDPTAMAIHLACAPNAAPFIESTLKKLGLNYTLCANPNEVMIQRNSEVILG